MRHPKALLLAVFLTAGVSNLFGALTATITSVNQTQAILEEQGFTGTCTIQVSTSPAMSPLHPDVNGAEYPGASTDDGRADTLATSAGGTKIVTIGHQTDDRALAAHTTYYFQVSGCGGAVTGSFTTANLSSGVTHSEASPFNSAKWGNLGLPAFDWTTKKPYVDPLTGVTMIPMTTSIATWRTGCGTGGCGPNSLPFTDWTGGAGWTNPAGVLAGAATNASTSNTNPLDIYADISTDPWPMPYDWHRLLEDIGLVVWGSGTSAAAADRTIDVCIFLNPTAGCASNTIKIVLPTGAVAPVSSGSSDPDGAFPAAFPANPFYGWTSSVSPLIRMENHETFGTASTSGNTLTLAYISTSQHFSGALSAGQRIYVSGSSCTNSLCTVAGPPSSPSVLPVMETLPTGTASFRAYGWGIRIWKDDANGTATVGVQYKLAGSNPPLGMQSGGDKCGSAPVTSGDGKTGYLCEVTSAILGAEYVAFIATDGTTRILWLTSGNVSFDREQGNVFYGPMTNSSGGWSVGQYTYTGDYTTELNFNYTCSATGACPIINTDVAGPVDLMPHALNADLDQQIEANQGVTLPAYNAALYGPWTQANGAVHFYGSSGYYAFYCNVYAGQGNLTSGGPGWCAVIDLSQSPAKVVRLIHTLDGTGIPHARFGSLHDAIAVDSNPNILVLGLDALLANNTSTMSGGPYQAPVQSLLMGDGVTWNTNTCLDWPPGAGTTCASQNYYRTCPAGTVPFTECVTFRLPLNGVCNVAATAVEKATWPCPWNPNYSQYPVMQPGDNAVDIALFGGVDSEHFRILSETPDAGNTTRVVAARNATYDYCSFSPWHGQKNPLSAQSANQLQHASGWSITMMPGYVNACYAGQFIQDESTGNAQELGRSFVQHSAMGAGSSGVNFVTASTTIFNTPFGQLGQVPPVLVNTGSPAFHGIGSGIGGNLQSYTDDSQLTAGPAGFPWALDMNPLVACGAESLGCGQLRATTAMGGNVYKIQSIGTAAPSESTYKTQPMIGWAGRYQLADVSGPSSSVDSTPWSMCFVMLAGECHAGSAVNEVYVNVPTAYDPGYCSGSISWINIPCVAFGLNAPAGGIRQFHIYANDSNGSSSRFVGEGWSSPGRHYPYTHVTAYPNGNWVMMMGSNSIDGFSMTGFMISLPPWQETSQPNNDFKTVTITLPRGSRYAQVQFGYSRYIGPGRSPASALYCTARAENCQSSNTSAPFGFASADSASVTQCALGCTISIPVIQPNVLYYQILRSTDAQHWQAADVRALALP